MNDPYRPYYLTDNPFPADSSLYLGHSDKRINGTIFDEEIFEQELAELDKRLRRRMNLIYCQNTSEFVRGVGKSAIIAHAWRKLSESGGHITTVYIRSTEKQTPAALSKQVISEWHREGFLWRVLAQSLGRYVEAAPSPEITPEGVKLLVQKKWPVDRVDLRAFLCYNPSRLMNSLAAWACAVDQFEDAIHGLRGKDLIVFSSEMRRLLEAGIGRMSIIVTLHPGAVTTLEAPEGQEFVTLAPLDGRHRVDVEPLNPSDTEALAITYLEEFRTETPPDPLFPLTPEAVGHIHEVAEGNIREILTGFSLCIEEGVDAGHPPLTLDFLHSKHEEITGRISPEHISLG